MTEATMFHMLETVLQDLYNARARTEDNAKKEKYTKWIEILSGSPTVEQFEEIVKGLQND